jgi:hypothetical protein
MKWKYINAKAIGTSHIATNEPCQDSYVVGEITCPFGRVFYTFVSDGAGSATQGKRGAEIACATAEDFINTIDVETLKNISESRLFELFETIVEQIKKVATEDNLIPRDYACTFLGAIVSSTGASYVQIGDGAIVTRLELQENYNTVFWPDTGEYANATNFVTDENASSFFKCKCVNEVPIELAIFTDGLQRLCLRFDEQVVHSPFFTPMFKSIKECPNDTELFKLNTKLGDFLNSSKINERTDDDKTLVLAVRFDNEQ